MEKNKRDKIAKLIEKHAINANQISIRDIKALQTAIGVRADGDFGPGSSRALLKAFKEDPSLLGNASPAIIKMMQDNGLGKDLQKIVAGNEDLKNKIIADTKELLTNPTYARSYTMQQTKLSLLGLYNDKIDGKIDKNQRDAISSFNEQYSSDTNANISPESPTNEDQIIAVKTAPTIEADKETETKQETGWFGLNRWKTKLSEIFGDRVEDDPPEEKVEIREENNSGITTNEDQIIAVKTAPTIETDKETETKQETDWFGLNRLKTTLSEIFGDHVEDDPPEDNAPEEKVAIKEENDSGITIGFDDKGLPTANFSLLASFSQRSPSTIPGISLASIPESTSPNSNIYRHAYKPVLDLIAETESNGNYNVANGNVNKHYSNMSINQVLDDQHSWVNKRNRAYNLGVNNKKIDPEKVSRNDYSYEGQTSSAAGAYQIKYSTLNHLVTKLDLTGNEIFNKSMQDWLGAELLARKGFDNYLAGHTPRETIMKDIAKEWASFPVNQSGESYYGGVGNNRALIRYDNVSDILKHSKMLYDYINRPPVLVVENILTTNEVYTSSPNQDDLALNTAPPPRILS